MLRIKLYLFLLFLLGVQTLSQAQNTVVTITVMLPTVTSGGSIQVTSPSCGEVRLASEDAGTVSCGTQGVTYQWYEGNTPLSETTLTGVSEGVHTYTRRTVAVGNPASYLEVSSSVTVASCITVNGGAITAPSGTVCAGIQFTIASGTAATASSGGVAYSWTVNGTAVSGAGATLNYTAPSAGLYAFVRTATSVLDGTKSAPATVSVTVAVPVDGPGGGCTDSDGNNYKTVWIGCQEWMAENLKRAHRTGCGVSWDNTDPKYGRLYDWVAAMDCNVSSSANPSGVQGLCPDGWHLPSDAEWIQLENYLKTKYPNKVGVALKSTSGWSDGGDGTDAVGFCGLPGGYCFYNGTRSDQGDFGYWWSSTEYGSNNAWGRSLNYTDSDLSRFNNFKTSGNSVRCLKN